jgi:murein DD-endopeptidase MepM/ murein hydrolase activator NlpD
MMKKNLLLLILLIGIHFIYAQHHQKRVKKSKKHRTTLVCPSVPEDFYQFFQTSFIDFSSLREGEKVSTFSFSDSLCSPLKQVLTVTSPYGMRNGKKHYGADFRVNIGDTIRSIFCGRVRIAKWDDQYGLVVVIRNYNMSETVYAHLDKVFVRVNQEVEVGQSIGLGGNTGRSSAPHLHLELRYKGFPINPIISGKFLMKIPVKTAH